jgi:hypothetical protein
MAVAAKPYIRLFIVLLLIVAGVLAVRFARSRFLYLRREADNEFVSTYVELSIARERYGNSPDSLNLAFRAIYLKNNTDSVWLAAYIKKLAGQIEKSEHIWSKVATKLDSLQKNSASIDILK